MLKLLANYFAILPNHLASGNSNLLGESCLWGWWKWFLYGFDLQTSAASVINTLWVLMEAGVEELKLLQTAILLITTNTVVQHEALARVGTILAQAASLHYPLLVIMIAHCMIAKAVCHPFFLPWLVGYSCSILSVITMDHSKVAVWSYIICNPPNVGRFCWAWM